MLTAEQQAILDKYVSLVDIKKVYVVTTPEPISYKGKIVNISPMFANPSKKTVTIDIPLSSSAQTQMSTPTDDTDSSVTTPMYSTQILRITIQLSKADISWLLKSQEELSEIASAFFEIVKSNYLQTQQLPDTLKQFVNKTF